MEQMITSLGFPIACCLGLAYYVKYQNELMIKDNKEDKEMWTKELQYSREVNAKLLASNELLAKEISTKLDQLYKTKGVRNNLTPKIYNKKRTLKVLLLNRYNLLLLRLSLYPLYSLDIYLLHLRILKHLL